MRLDPEKFKDLSNEHVNVISDNKIYVLPVLVQDFAVVELFLTRGHVQVQSQHHPIRHGKHCGCRIFLGNSYGVIDLNPKFIWNGREWLLNTFGTFIFAEVEINAPRREQDENN
jgi:hypothetical protein